MYKIDKTTYGYKLTLSEMIKADEMKQWLEDSKKALASSPATFGIMVDMRDLKPLPPEAQPHMQEGQKLYKEKGMQRSAVILANAVITMQFKRIAKQTGIDQWERYIDASSDSNWEQTATEWIANGVDCDKTVGV